MAMQVYGAGPKIQERGLALVPARGAVEGQFGEQIGRGMQQVAAGLGDASRVAGEMEEQRQAANIANFELKARHFTMNQLNGPNGYTRTIGENADSGRAAFNASMGEFGDSIRQNAYRNPAERRRIEAVWAGISMQAESQANTHQNTQTVVARRGSQDALRRRLLNDAIEAPPGSDARDDAVAALGRLSQDFVVAEGAGGEVLRGRGEEDADAVANGTINHMLATNRPEEALAFYNANLPALRGDSETNLLPRIQDAVGHSYAINLDWAGLATGASAPPPPEAPPVAPAGGTQIATWDGTDEALGVSPVAATDGTTSAATADATITTTALAPATVPGAPQTVSSTAVAAAPAAVVPAVSRTQVTQPPRGPMQMRVPVPGRFGGRGQEYGAPRPRGVHGGLDFSAPPRTPVSAITDGVVEYAGWANNPSGNVVRMILPNGWTTGFAHLDSFDVRRNTIVRAGQTLARSGNSGVREGGRPYDPHLHMTLKDENGRPVDPTPYANGTRQLPEGTAAGRARYAAALQRANGAGGSQMASAATAQQVSTAASGQAAGEPMSATARSAAADAVTPDVVHANAILLSRGNPSTYARIHASGMAFIARRNAQRQEEREASIEAIQSHLMPDSGTRTISEVPEADLARLRPSDRVALANALDGRNQRQIAEAAQVDQAGAEAERRGLHAVAYQELSDLSMDRGRFVGTSLLPYAEVLGASDYAMFVNRQRDARLGRGQYEEAATTLAHQRAISGQVFAAAVAGETTRSGRAALLERRTDFDMRLDREVQSWATAHNGVPPDASQLRAMSSALLIEGTFEMPGNGWWGRGTRRGRAFEATRSASSFTARIPDDARRRLTSRYESQHGRRPTENDLLRLYSIARSQGVL